MIFKENMTPYARKRVSSGKPWRPLGMILLLCFACVGLQARSWEQIRSSGELRVLTIDPNREGLHRVVMPIDREQALLRGFARQQKLKLVYVEAPGFGELFTMLEADRGDLISANVAETAERKAKYLLSRPFAQTREMFFTAEDSPLRGSAPVALHGEIGWILPGTTYAENVRKLTQHDPLIVIKELPVTMSHDDLIDSVAAGEFAYSALNECDLDAWLGYRKGIRKLFALHGNVALVFALRKDAAGLLEELNRCIEAQMPAVKPAAAAPPEVKKTLPAPEKVKNKPAQKTPAAPAPPAAPATPEITGPVAAVSTGDLAAIRKRGYIRVLTLNNVFCCFLWKGQLCGFEYELARHFAASLDLMVVTVIPPDQDSLIPYLRTGKGDFIAANFVCTPRRMRSESDLTFCAPYGGVTQVLVGRRREKLSKLAELNGRTVYALRNSTQWEALRLLQNNGYRFQLCALPEGEGPLFTLKNVESGKYDLVATDDTFYKLAVDGGCRVRKLLLLSGEQPYTWVVRRGNPQLAAAVNKFFRKENRGLFFNMCRKKYYSVEQAQQLMPALNKKGQLVISKYDGIFRKYGERFGFDWYLLAAQAYQESRFQTNRVNFIGATGLMQVKPSTAKEMGIGRLTDPDNGVHAGAQYLDKMRRHFDAKITPENRLCFALASYNAGFGHVADARKLAAQRGLDPNVWFNNTEKAMALLETPKYAARARFGYCRASETIPYVQNIMLQAYHYRKMLELGEARKKSAAPQKK